MVICNVPDASTFAELRFLLDRLPDQTEGDPCAICQTGEPYVEFIVDMLARPGDEAAIERCAVELFSRQLSRYLSDKSGRIYWRTRLEHEWSPAYVVVRFDVNGPDLDYITDQRCVTDKNWRRIKGYCRLYRANFKSMEVEEARSAA